MNKSEDTRDGMNRGFSSGSVVKKLSASQVVLVVKNPPANSGNRRDMVSSLGREDPLEEGKAAHSSVLAMDIRAWRATVHRVTELDMAEAT